MADFERYEGMLVHFPQTLTVNETFTLGRFGEVGSRPTAASTPDRGHDPGAAALAQEDLNHRRSFVLDDGNNQQNIDPTLYPLGGLSASNTLRVGYTTAGLTGVFEQRFGGLPGPAGRRRSRSPRRTRGTAAPDPVGGNLRVASFNVLNFFNGNGSGGRLPDVARREHAVRVRPPEGEGGQRALGDQRGHRRPDGDRERRAAEQRDRGARRRR